MARIKHIAIRTEDVEKTAAFYKEAFGLKQVGLGQNGIYLSDGHLNIAILKFERGKNGGRRRDGFDVESFAFQKQAQCFTNIGLIVGDQNACSVGMWTCHDARSVSSHFTAIIVAKRFGCVVHGFSLSFVT